jgi:hypothetical protein
MKIICKFRNLCTVIPKQKFYEFPNHPFWRNFLCKIQLKDAKSDELIQLFMDQLILTQNTVDADDFAHIEKAIK